jgi:uncharacterized membrane protein YgcG
MCVDVIQNRVSHDALSKLTLNINNIYLPKVVVEDYFVPALNTMCEKQNIPDDVAGATFMAAGASAPEMFAAFLSLFVTHSAIGVGTILGSELFNHLIITAGSIFYANEGTIQTEPRFVGRECMCVVAYRIRLYLFILFFFFPPPIFSLFSFFFFFFCFNAPINQSPTAFFYALALGMLVFALQDNSDSQDCYNQLSRDQRTLIAKGDVDGYICVPWWKSLLLVLAYGVYAAVCGYYQKLIVLFCPHKLPQHKAISVKESVKSFSSLDLGYVLSYKKSSSMDARDGDHDDDDDDDDDKEKEEDVFEKQMSLTEDDGDSTTVEIELVDRSMPQADKDKKSIASSSSSSSSSPPRKLSPILKSSKVTSQVPPLLDENTNSGGGGGGGGGGSGYKRDFKRSSSNSGGGGNKFTTNDDISEGHDESKDDGGHATDSPQLG